MCLFHWKPCHRYQVPDQQGVGAGCEIRSYRTHSKNCRLIFEIDASGCDHLASGSKLEVEQLCMSLCRLISILEYRHLNRLQSSCWCLQWIEVFPSVCASGCGFACRQALAQFLLVPLVELAPLAWRVTTLASRICAIRDVLQPDSVLPEVRLFLNDTQVLSAKENGILNRTHPPTQQVQRVQQPPDLHKAHIDHCNEHVHWMVNIPLDCNSCHLHFYMFASIARCQTLPSKVSLRAERLPPDHM